MTEPLLERGEWTISHPAHFISDHLKKELSLFIGYEAEWAPDNRSAHGGEEKNVSLPRI
jgi:hypothetical protein